MSVGPKERNILEGRFEFILGQDPVVLFQGTPVGSFAKICESGIWIWDRRVVSGPRGSLEPEVDAANDQSCSEGAENGGLPQAAWHGNE